MGCDSWLLEQRREVPMKGAGGHRRLRRADAFSTVQPSLPDKKAMPCTLTKLRARGFGEEYSEKVIGPKFPSVLLVPATLAATYDTERPRPAPHGLQT